MHDDPFSSYISHSLTRRWSDTPCVWVLWSFKETKFSLSDVRISPWSIVDKFHFFNQKNMKKKFQNAINPFHNKNTVHCHKCFRHPILNVYLCSFKILSNCCYSGAQPCQLFVTPWTAAWQPSLLFAISWSLLKLMSIESIMPSNHPVVCHPLLFMPTIFPSIRVFSSKSVLHIR